MISKIIAWIIELFRSKPKKQKDLEQKVDNLKEDLKEIQDEDNSPSDNIDYLNK